MYSCLVHPPCVPQAARLSFHECVSLVKGTASTLDAALGRCADWLRVARTSAYQAAVLGRWGTADSADGKKLCRLLLSEDLNGFTTIIRGENGVGKTGTLEQVIQFFCGEKGSASGVSAAREIVVNAPDEHVLSGWTLSVALTGKAGGPKLGVFLAAWMVIVESFEARRLKTQAVQDAAEAQLSEEDRMIYKYVMGPGSMTEVLASREFKANGYIALTRGTLRCMRPYTWLNDEVVNFFGSALCEDRMAAAALFGGDDQLASVAPLVPKKLHFANTFFWNRFFADAGKVDSAVGLKWFMREKIGFDLLDGALIVPHNDDMNHWTLSFLYPRLYKIDYMNSYLKGGKQQLACMVRLLQDFAAKDERSDELSLGDEDEFNVVWQVTGRKDIPAQGRR